LDDACLQPASGQALPPLVVVEGYFGAIRLHRKHVLAVALMGSTISEEQVALLREHCPRLKALTVMLDGREAGQKAADAVALRLARHWWVRLALLSEGEQPDTVEQPKLLALLWRKPPNIA
jgi:DNA primase